MVSFTDKEEFLYLMNLMNSKSIKDNWPEIGGEQGFINEVYLWEKFDIGPEYNVLASTVLYLRIQNIVHNASIFEFSGSSKPDKCPMRKPWLAVCNKWNYYRDQLQLT